MDKIGKAEIIRKGLIYIFILIGTITLLLLFGGMFTGVAFFFNKFFNYIATIIIMVIFAITTKYVGDILIIWLNGGRLTKD
ncbi:hypothetical protein LCGC14_0778120 [marine sediment metagenome]|uniref:Uncharacterized protein n=1 Tax=marine sediment metagenome TaxID=412755 RepID=A0A0F9Q0K1_9ZZZZ|nr:MAG: hypothetical protein Lokiarch_32590 [Candidatus Lokiarchaeum sp. GC14_75]